MAVGVEESSTESILTDNEHRLVREDAERQTAYAVLALNQAATELGLDTDLLEAAATLRVTMASLAPKEQRKMRKSLERVGALLIAGKPDVLAEVVSLPDTIHTEQALDEEAVTDRGQEAEPAPEPEATTADSESAHEDTETSESEISPQAQKTTADDEIVIDRTVAEKFYKRINALSTTGDLIAFEPYDEDEVFGLIALYAQANTKKIGMKSAVRLRMVLEGKKFDEVSAAELEDGGMISETQFSNFKSMVAPQFMATHLEKLFSSEQKASEQQAERSITPAKPTQVSPPAANPSRTRVEPRERPIGEEPPHVQIAARFAKILDLDSGQETAWRSMLDPANRQGELTRNKVEVCNLIIDELAARGWTNIHDGYFDKLIQSVQAAKIYKLLGLPYNPQALVSNRRLPTNASVASQIEEARRNGGRPNEVADQIFSGLATIARELRENPKV